MRAWVWVVTCCVLAVAVTGCGAGAVLSGLGIDSLGDDDDSGGAADSPPNVSSFTTHPEGSRDRIRIEFSISNDDEGSLSAKIEFIELVDGQPQGTLRAASLLPGSDALQVIPSDTTVTVLWDAKQDLDDRYAEVEDFVTPIEDGVPGKPFPSGVVAAGNTPAKIRAVEVDPADFELVELGKGTGIRFPITRFGSYLVTFERERTGGD